MLEFKHVDPIRIKNYIRLFVTGNPDWLIPAGVKERRFAVFDMEEDHIQDHAYFAAIDDEMNNGGREALMHYLLNVDLSQVNLRSIPKTAALLDQQVMKGVLPPMAPGVDQHGTCLKTNLHQCYVRHAQLQGAHYRSIETKLGMFMRAQLEPFLRSKRHAVGLKRLSCYELPTLMICRMLFAEKLGQTIDWGSIGSLTRGSTRRGSTTPTFRTRPGAGHRRSPTRNPLSHHANRGGEDQMTSFKGRGCG